MADFLNFTLIIKNVAHGQWCYPGDQIQKFKNKLVLHKARKRIKRAK